MPLQITDEARVRTIVLDRPEALNAFNEELYDATADALSATDALTTAGWGHRQVLPLHIVDGRPVLLVARELILRRLTRVAPRVRM